MNCGGHNGCSARWFRDVIDQKNEFHIHSFEPDPRFWRSYQDLENHTLHKKALWKWDGRVDFYLSDTPLGNGSSVIKEKKTGYLDKDNPISVKCIDFSQWIKRYFKLEDYIFVKMDIEGAEYEVLNKMIKDNTLCYMDRLTISWHWDKITGRTKEQHNIFLKRLKENLKIPIEHWRFVQYSKYSLPK